MVIVALVSDSGSLWPRCPEGPIMPVVSYCQLNEASSAHQPAVAWLELIVLCILSRSAFADMREADEQIGFCGVSPLHQSPRHPTQPTGLSLLDSSDTNYRSSALCDHTRSGP